MKRFVLGNIRQGGPGRAWQVGDTIDARSTNLLFLSKDFSADDPLEKLVHDVSKRRMLKRIGGIAFTIGEIVGLPDQQLRAASLDLERDSVPRYVNIFTSIKALGYGCEALEKPFITLTSQTSLSIGDGQYSSYISVLECLGDGRYSLHHDFQHHSDPNGWRYETFMSDGD